MAGESKIEIVIAVIAVIFFILGVYLNKKSLHSEKPSDNEIDQSQIDAIGLSKREYEVLIQIHKGFSNKEIAEHLFLSESTIKTHVSNILVKLDAKRRTQAIQKAKALQILPS
ncbi:DNA-binding response regulator [Spongiivirga citrea]|uniref:DNA-binding response regulator n=2 Tax=Spongiivirga citrea TaxID=1481457 RepID=A0A6M0CJD9_9FLAO|nr:DNA-binding response regulator [Spongiivirga citrea]